MRRQGQIGPIEWATARRPLPGETVCGDYPIAVDVPGGAALFGVADGLGHGAAAETAALRAEEVVNRCRSEPLDVLLQLCHRSLSDTRGAAVTLARIDFGLRTLSWIGIGNVTADLVAKRPGGAQIRASALLAGGIVGYRIPHALTTHQVPISPGDLLVIATDGILEDHVRDIDFAAPATAIADHILDAYSRESDDALVLTARHRGTLS
ncbi:SpoIIE family protein phosphatase [Mycobacterium sp. 3519A]|jgi:serine/threonine protein phosphatase PrpC|uniref:SpoIIE family protein phosphatase n=1 Tax=Mycobacterium sp. 3519A TaxID=2057184 RepID=UPI000C7AC896|nr:SpoIIE family protein phosphatase [Mycobacterium sp. 3519A]